MTTNAYVSHMNQSLIISPLQTFDLSFLYDIEVFSDFTLFKDEFSKLRMFNLQTIDKLQLVVLVQILKQVNLLDKVQLNVPSLNRTLNDNMLKYSPFYSPYHALISSSHTGCSLVIIQ